MNCLKAPSVVICRLRRPIDELRVLSKKYSINVRWWPTLQNPWEEKANSQASELDVPKISYESSKEDFKWVKKVISDGAIPPPRVDLQVPTPSGWIPPNPEVSKSYPYSVRRSRNHMLPIYFEEKHRKVAERSHGTRSLTVIKNVDGDMWVYGSEAPVQMADVLLLLIDCLRHNSRLVALRNHVHPLLALAEDLRTLLEPKCDGGLFLCQVDEATRRLRIEGIFLEEVAQFLISRGF